MAELGHLTLRFHRRCFPAILFDLVLELLPFVERAQAGTLHSRDMNTMAGQYFLIAAGDSPKLLIDIGRGMIPRHGT